MIRLAVVLLLSLFALSPAVADEDRARRLAEDILEETNTRAMLEGMRGQLTGVIEAQLAKLHQDDPALESTKRMQKRIIDLLFNEMSWEKMKDQYISIYTSVFTEDELKDLLRFYRSRLGRKFTEKMPAVMEASIKISQAQMERIMPEMQKLIKEAVEEETP